MVKSTPKFPIVDALLLTPKESTNGVVGICTNTSAPGQVFNEIKEKHRLSISVLGPLIANRDGTERMILNTLSHPTLKYLILFSEETLTFSPSTNLLLAIKNGIDTTTKEGNSIIGGVAMSAHFPNLSKKILAIFRKEIIVLPIFMHKNKASSSVVNEYIDWLESYVQKDICDYIRKTNEKPKIYYDALNTLIEKLQKIPIEEKNAVDLDPKDFQHLQPPEIILKDKKTLYDSIFTVSSRNKNIRLDIKIGKNNYFIEGKDDFQIEYSLMKFLKSKKKLISPLNQLLIGAELNRVNTEILNNVSFPSFIKKNNIRGTKEILLESKINLTPDREYYYKIGLKDSYVSVMCMAFDVCEEVFELKSRSLPSIFEWMIEKNRFENYEMDILHRMDIGGQIGRAIVALQSGYLFVQDFASIFKINKSRLPLLISESDNFLDVHRSILLNIYTQGLTEKHGDERKGLARTGIVLAIYRKADTALKIIPQIYVQGDQSTKKMREAYKKQLLRFDADGSYSYGERTRSFFGFDQLPKTIELLKKNPGRATAIQRFDPSIDMGTFKDNDTRETKYTHDPCLTHDIFFIKDNTLHSFHIARAHNTANAYPENIFGLYDAYVSTVKKGLRIKNGDMYMLSSRANILLLTENQRVQKIIAEPSKPMNESNSTSGPYLLGSNVKKNSKNASGISFFNEKLRSIKKRPDSSFLQRIEKFEKINTLKRAITYLKKKGGSHNNPVLTTHQAGKTDPQGEHLIYFQANVFGGRLHATAVFINRHSSHLNEDTRLVGYITGQYKAILKKPLGDASIFYVNSES